MTSLALTKTRTMRATLVLVAAALALLAVGVANADARGKITGGSTTLTVAPAVVTAVGSVPGLTVTPIAPATSTAANTYTFPIVGGRYGRRGATVLHDGGLRFAASPGTLDLTKIRAVVHRRSKRGAVFARATVCRAAATTTTASRRFPRRVRNLRPGQCARRTVHVGNLRNVVVTDAGTGQATATGELRLSADAAHAINRVAGRRVASRGTVLGTVASNVTYQAPAAS